MVQGSMTLNTASAGTSVNKRRCKGSDRRKENTKHLKTKYRQQM